MSVNEVYAAFEWLDSVLMGDSTLAGYAPGGLWRGLAPPGTATPFVVMSLQSGLDSLVMTGFRILVDGLFLVKCVGPATISSQIAQASARVDDLIGKPSVAGNVTGAYIASSYRENPLFMDEIVSGELWTNAGGLYRILIQQTT